MEHLGYPLGNPGVLQMSGWFHARYEALATSSSRVRFEYLDGARD